MNAIAGIMIAVPLGLFVWAYAAYPLMIWLLGRARSPYVLPPEPRDWPLISISLPVYNEENRIQATLEALLATDYPERKRQIVVCSDASTDATEEIVRTFATRGVELIRLQERRGKTAAENAAARSLRGEIVINTDASVQVMPRSVKPLVRALLDPAVGVASGRDVSVGAVELEANRGESGYVGFEMWLRAQETRVASIVGASGCYYATRRSLHDRAVPEHLSRDFAAALWAQLNGYRSVSVDDAICLVPRTARLTSEFRRKVRTMARGLDTLWYHRRLLNPIRYGAFAMMLVSHKLCRWLVPLLAPLAVAGLVVLSVTWPPALPPALLLLALLVVGTLALSWPGSRRPPRLVSLLGYAVAGTIAGFVAWTQAIFGEKSPTWEPTRRVGARANEPETDGTGKTDGMI
jgi:cellulose synthase/poly-beta-1,6-N-acetylglucosamine synthase-like glycosyltransferase